MKEYRLTDWLPTTKKEVELRGWDELDVILFSGDAYSKEDQNLLKKLRSDMLSTIEYAPVWIIMAVALALGIGTMIGWRRVAMTIGEKIGLIFSLRRQRYELFI